MSNYIDGINKKSDRYELVSKPISDSIADAFSNTKTYAIGDYVMYEGKLYRCKTAVTTAGNWAQANWELVNIVDDIIADFKSEVSSTYATKGDLNPEQRTDITYTITDQQKYIAYADGTVGSSVMWDCTDYIDVSKYNKLEYKRGKTPLTPTSIGMAFYDSSKTYISGIPIKAGSTDYGYTTDEVSVPSNAIYARFSRLHDTSQYGNFSVTGINSSSISDIIDILQSTVKFTEQSLTESQKAQARKNIGVQNSETTKIILSDSDFENKVFSPDGSKGNASTIRLSQNPYSQVVPEEIYKIDIDSSKTIIWFVIGYADSAIPGEQLQSWAQSGETITIPDGINYIRIGLAISDKTSDISPSDINKVTISKLDTSVKFTEQTLTESQKAQARANIGIEEKQTEASDKKQLYVGPIVRGYAIGNYIDYNRVGVSNIRACMRDLVVFPSYYKKYKFTFNPKYVMSGIFGRSAYDMSYDYSLSTLNGGKWVESGTIIEIPEFLNYYRFTFALKNTTQEIPDAELTDVNLVVEYDDPSSVENANDTPTELISNARGVMDLRSAWDGGQRKNWTPQLFVMGHTSDPHGDYYRVKNFFDYCEYIHADVACVTGDIIATNIQSGGGWFEELVNNSRHILPAMCIGNHEVYGSAGTYTYPTDEQVYDEYFTNIADKIKNTTGKTYYSVLIDDKKIKIISLNMYQYDSTPSNNRYFVHYNADQITWFINELQNTPAGYGVILLYHQPDGPSMPTPSEGYTKFYQVNDGYNRIYGSLSGSPIVDTIDAFISRGTINHTYQQNGVPSSFTINADFSSVASGVEFIAHLTGHAHRDKIAYYPNAQHKQLSFNITLTNATYWGNSSSDAADNNDQIRTMGTKAQDAFNVYVVDRTNKKVKIIRVGNTKTVDMQDRDYMEIPYAD